MSSTDANTGTQAKLPYGPEEETMAFACIRVSESLETRHANVSSAASHPASETNAS